MREIFTPLIDDHKRQCPITRALCAVDRELHLVGAGGVYPGVVVGAAPPVTGFQMHAEGVGRWIGVAWRWICGTPTFLSIVGGL